MDEVTTTTSGVLICWQTVIVDIDTAVEEHLSLRAAQ